MMIAIRKVLKKRSFLNKRSKKREDGAINTGTGTGTGTGTATGSSVSSTVVGERETEAEAIIPQEVQTNLNPKESKSAKSAKNFKDQKVSACTSTAQVQKEEKTKTKPKEAEALILTDREIQAGVTSLLRQQLGLQMDVSVSSAQTSDLAMHSTTSSSFVSAQVSKEDLQERRKTIQEFIRIVNTHDMEQARQFVTPDVQFQFTAPQGKQLEVEFSWEEWSGAHCHINASFPDFSFRYQQVNDKLGVVILTGFRASGTHTGTPFAFGPLDPIPPSGKFIENDPEQAYFYFRNDNHTQFCRVTWYTTGEMTGPDGFYTQLGGFPTL
ncbi:expressed unknown protein [Seminavis robusta]|uniref:Uncharacterized protein n=1 Tax=Seminavis robusta TaxID=568900 RepID=A0A9N8E831_9STRA|nr:expressed unknown protein [Seminavis robusta]|eukprot:Sro651_g181500.1 n/a (325) ;mRNA; r:10002-10976